MKKLLTALVFLVSLCVYSQDPFFQKSDPEAEKEAIKISNQYNAELSLTAKQLLLMQQKIEEFLIKRKKIESEFTGREKLDLLYQLQQEETAEMNDILTQPQLKLYKEIKPTIQPLETIKKEE